MFKKLKRLFASSDDDEQDKPSLPSRVPVSPAPAEQRAVEKPKVVLSRAELKLHSLWGDYTKLGKREEEKKKASWDHIVPVLNRVTADRSDRIDELCEVRWPCGQVIAAAHVLAGDGRQHADQRVRALRHGLLEGRRIGRWQGDSRPAGHHVEQRAAAGSCRTVLLCTWLSQWCRCCSCSPVPPLLPG